jgi:hypothetical protein
MKSVAEHNKEVKQAHKLHAKAVQPFLQKIVNLMKTSPKSSTFKIKYEIDENNRIWKKYCNKYQATHKDKYPNRRAFIDSLKMYFKDNELLTGDDLNFIFNNN